MVTMLSSAIWYALDTVTVADVKDKIYNSKGKPVKKSRLYSDFDRQKYNV